MSQTSNKATFVRHADPDAQIVLERTKRNWMPHTVALLILAPNGDQIATALPGIARRNDAKYIQTPPQLRMSRTVLKKVYKFGTEGFERSVQKTALVASREFLNMKNIHQYNDQDFFTLSGNRARKHNRLVYIGSTRGNDNRDGRIIKYGKFFHWVAIRLDRYADVFRNDSQVYQEPQWVNAKRLAAMPAAMAMSQRKLEMLDQALLEYYQVTGDYNKLVAAATQRQSAMAA